MRLDLSTSDFIYAGLPRPGFPLLTDDDFSPLEPFHSFLIGELLDDGPALKPLTWEAYGRRIWDFACFLRGQGVDWRPGNEPSGEGPVIRYRTWSRLQGQSVEVSTLNDRLSIVARFYEWALRTGRIETLPFKLPEVRLRDDSGSFEYHASGGRKRGLKPHESAPPLEFLTKPQVATVRNAQLNPTHRLMFEMAGRTGLRSCELRTFPLRYVFNPAARSGLDPNGVIRKGLKPGDMELKFDKGRTVEIPYSLMQDMYAYALIYRRGLLCEGDSQPTLLLTARGRAFSKDGVVEAFKSISELVGFRVRAHMMRHTFAIYFLLTLQSIPEYRGDALQHLMNQLGHKNIQSVLVYLNHIGHANVAATLSLQRRLDDIFAD